MKLRAACLAPAADEGVSIGRQIGFMIALSGAVAALIALGVWQIERRASKNELIARLEGALTALPVDYEPPRLGSEAERQFTRVRITGEFQGSGTVKLLMATPESDRSLTRDGFGYRLFTPFKFKGGIIFVDRGFVPQSLAEAMAPPSGSISVTGMVRISQIPSAFTPFPDIKGRRFYAADIASMADAAGFAGTNTITREYIQAERSADGGWPHGQDPRALLAAIPNRHLEYALTWFGLAAVFLISGIFALRSFARKASSQS